MPTSIIPMPNVKGTLVVTGEEQTVILENLDSTYVEIVNIGTEDQLDDPAVESIITAKNAGTYPIKLRLKYPLYTSWENEEGEESTADLNLTWTIKPYKVAIPSQYGDVIYNGKEQQPSWVNHEDQYIGFSGDYFAIEAGNYTMHASLRNPEGHINYVWEDDTSEDKDLPWVIKDQPTELNPYFYGSKTFVFTGQEQGPKYEGFDENTMSITDHLKTDCGTYTAHITPKTNYAFVRENEETGEKEYIYDISLEWQIVPVKIRKPTIADNKVYNGKEQGPDLPPIDQISPEYFGTTSAIDAGTYHLTLTLNDNYEWEDGSTGPVDIEWSILPRPITKLPVAPNLVYNGKEQQPSWRNCEPGQYTASGYFAATNAGTYMLRFTPTNNYTWADGTRTNKNILWTILESKDKKTYSVLDDIATLSGGINNGAYGAAV